MTYPLALIGTLLLSACLTFVWKKLPRRYDLLDVPNQRSSHAVPTPRGGGVAIVAAFLPIPIWLLADGDLSRSFSAVIAAGLFVACVGLADDFRPLAVSWRLIAQLLAAASAIAVIGVPQAAAEYSVQSWWHWSVLLLATLSVVWHINLFNFMDGIDGIAGSQAVFVATSAAFLAWTGSEVAFSLVLACLAAACLGFLVWNWPPAKIFMGDAGSGFLGLTLPLLALYSSAHSILSIWTWVILMAAFIADASVTLCIRVLGKQDVYRPHRSHAYQRSARRFNSHVIVTVGFIMMNVIWLLPLAYVSHLHPRYSMTLTIVAFIPLILLALLFGAGRREAGDN